MTAIRKLPVPLDYQDWFSIGLLFVLLAWLLAFIALAFYVAEEKGRSGLALGFPPLFFTPLLALIALAALPDKLGQIGVTVEPSEADEVPEYKWRKG